MRWLAGRYETLTMHRMSRRKRSQTWKVWKRRGVNPEKKTGIL
jgi:hypothetical protein